MTVECTGTIRGNYMCTQCLGEYQPKDGPTADLLFVVVFDGDTDSEEYVCTPCMDAALDGTRPWTRLVIEVPPQ